MATLLLVDGVRWGNQQVAASSSSLSSLQRPDNCLVSPPSTCDRHTKAPIVTTRCVSSSNIIDRLDPQLPRFPSHENIKGNGTSSSRVILETRPTWSPPSYDESLDTLEKPSSPPLNVDTSYKLPPFTDGQEVDMRRSQRISPNYLSMSQSRRAMANGAVLQATSTPLRMKDLKGTTNIYVGFAAIILGFMAVLQKGGLLGNNNAPTTLCSGCYGYGMKPCHLCKGRGSITWEGKFLHTDVCPACLGARIRKCSDCGGFRMRNDVPPFYQQSSKARSSKARP